MPIIRSEQIAALRAHATERFIREVAEYLRSDFANQLATNRVPATEVQEIIRAGISRARGYGISSDRDLRAYAEFQAVLGPLFDQDPKYPAVRQVLTDPNRDGRAKIEAIDQILLFGGDVPR